jgi:hypothetical protein
VGRNTTVGRSERFPDRPCTRSTNRSSGRVATLECGGNSRVAVIWSAAATLAQRHMECGGNTRAAVSHSRKCKTPLWVSRARTPSVPPCRIPRLPTPPPARDDGAASPSPDGRGWRAAPGDGRHSLRSRPSARGTGPSPLPEDPPCTEVRENDLRGEGPGVRGNYGGRRQLSRSRHMECGGNSRAAVIWSAAATLAQSSYGVRRQLSRSRLALARIQDAAFGLAHTNPICTTPQDPSHPHPSARSG